MRRRQGWKWTSSISLEKLQVLADKDRIIRQLRHLLKLRAIEKPLNVPEIQNLRAQVNKRMMVLAKRQIAIREKSQSSRLRHRFGFWKPIEKEETNEGDQKRTGVLRSAFQGPKWQAKILQHKAEKPGAGDGNP